MSRCTYLPYGVKCPLKVAAGRKGGLKKSTRKTRACRNNARKCGKAQ